MTIPAIPRGPERAWTTCRSGAAISGLFRSDYAPENVQALPPGMTADEYDALPLTPGCPGPFEYQLDNGCFNDCLPRYVPWVEQSRTPDFAGGDPILQWTRGKGWEERPGCAVPVILEVRFWCGALDNPDNFAGGTFDVYLDGSATPWYSGSYAPATFVADVGLLPEGTTSVRVVGFTGNNSCGFDADSGWITPPGPGQLIVDVVYITS